MGSFDRSKKRVQLWKKAIFHFALCFIMGFFTGFAPSNSNSIFSGNFISNLPVENEGFSPESTEMLHLHQAIEIEKLNRSHHLTPETPAKIPASSGDYDREFVKLEDDPELIPQKLLIIVTPTGSNDRFQEAYLRRLGNTLKLVASPLLWIVVESQSEFSEMPEILRKTGVMTRHLVLKKNLTDPEEEMDHQRNFALNHIEHHRLNGIVHFAGLSNVYDLKFFQEIREIEVFGAWPMASVSENRKRVVVEGPVCDSNQVVIGWHVRSINNNQISPSNFAFNSSILWDPERWGRPSSIQDNSQNSIKFVQQVVLEDESKLMGVPRDGCSKIMLWHTHIPTRTTPIQ